jgi:hypothetical protein
MIVFNRLMFVAMFLLRANFAVAQCGPNGNRPYVEGTTMCAMGAGMMMAGGGSSGSTQSSDCPAEDGEQV